MVKLYRSMSLTKRLLISSAVLALLLAVFILNAFADATGPVFSKSAPIGQVADRSQISIDTADTDGINGATIQMKLNGTVVPVTVEYPEIGHWEQQTDSCSGEIISVWVIDTYDYTKATIRSNYTYDPKDINIVTVSAADKLNNSASYDWTFIGTKPPSISSLAPANGSVVTNNMPVISAFLSDLGGPVDPASIALKVDGNQVSHTFKNNQVSYTPAEMLSVGTHNVSLDVKDMVSNAATAAWSFSILQGTIVLSSPSPVSLVNVANPTITLRAVDTIALDKNSVRLTINGRQLVPAVNFDEIGGHYETYEDTCTGPYQVWIPEYDYTKANITLKPAALPDGINQVSVSIGNANGMSSYSWSFTVDAPPAISPVSPVDKSMINTLTPAISGKIVENSSVSSVELTIDGNSYPVTYNAATGIASGTVTAPLKNYDYDHIVKMTVKDQRGTAGTTTWTFRTKGCAECHADFPVPKHPVDNCGACHGPIIEDCGSCHGSSTYRHGPEVLVSAWDHGGSVTWSCEDCHNQSIAAPVHTTPANADLHNTASNVTNCTPCHKASLVYEHGERSDDTGKSYDCNTCHRSSNPLVQQAIANKKTNCDACHTTISTDGHSTVHETTTLDDKCTTCHKNNLTDEHINNTITQKAPLNCAVCHESNRKLVQNALAAGDKNCTSCHRQGHNVSFAQAVPADIPLYDQLVWATPIDATIFAGEPWLNQGMLAVGKIVISQRTPNAAAAKAYIDSEFTARGWTTKTDQSVEGQTDYTKGDRSAYVFVYTGPVPNTTGADFGGYRIMIVYN